MKSLIMKPLLVFCCLFALQIMPAGATHLRVSGLAVELPAAGEKTGFIRCTLTWDNAWRDDYNHDAAWVFLKFQPADAQYNSRHLAIQPGGHVLLEKPADGPEPQFTLAGDGTGLFVFCAEKYRGPVRWTLRLAFDASSVANFDLKNGEWSVHALEMVFSPASPLTVGDPDSLSWQAGGFYRSGANGQPDGLYRIEREDQPIAVGESPGALNYRARNPEYQGDRQGPVPPAFPKGVVAFYCMKYEITQGQYADFLNALGQQATYFRANFSGKGYAESRGSIGFDGQRYTAQSPDRPLNFVSWDDGCAYLDWAGLRPMTELEYEKACRGSETPLAHEFPWGTADKKLLARFVDLDDELKFRPGTDESFGGSDRRAVLGAGRCGALDLAGSLWERVVSIGHPAGRAYTGSHGDGRLDGYGFATNTDWPRGDDERTGGYGYRGGGYYEHGKPAGDFNPHSPVGWRNFAAWAGGPRSIAYGFRGVRSGN